MYSALSCDCSSNSLPVCRAKAWKSRGYEPRFMSFEERAALTAAKPDAS